MYKICIGIIIGIIISFLILLDELFGLLMIDKLKKLWKILNQ
jgi:hypothetical protein